MASQYLIRPHADQTRGFSYKSYSLFCLYWVNMNLYNLSFVKSPSHYSVISDLSASFVRFLTQDQLYCLSVHIKRYTIK